MWMNCGGWTMVVGDLAAVNEMVEIGGGWMWPECDR